VAVDDVLEPLKGVRAVGLGYPVVRLLAQELDAGHEDIFTIAVVLVKSAVGDAHSPGNAGH
jgi:hypothetical protein